MVPVATAGLRAELGEARALADELTAMTPAQADSSWRGQLEDEYCDFGTGNAVMMQQLTW